MTSREQIYKAALEKILVIQREMFGDCITNPCRNDCVLYKARAALEAAAKVGDDDCGRCDGTGRRCECPRCDGTGKKKET